jgi:hypothetical protein
MKKKPQVIKTYRFSAKDISVDTGQILIADEEFYLKNGGLNGEERLLSRFEVDPGVYIVKGRLKLASTEYAGPAKNCSGLLLATTGVIIVADPGYHIDNDELWQSYNHFAELKLLVGAVPVYLGMDGGYDFGFTAEKVSELGPQHTTHVLPKRTPEPEEPDSSGGMSR